jgi:DNA repair exonuclease SbcCD ATPase subunit
MSDFQLKSCRRSKFDESRGACSLQASDIKTNLEQIVSNVHALQKRITRAKSLQKKAAELQAELSAIEKDAAYLSAADLKACEEQLARLQNMMEDSPGGAGEHLKAAEEKEKAMASELECSVCLEVPRKAFFSGMKFHSNNTKKLNFA